MHKKIALLLGLAAVMLLAGCTQIDQPIKPGSEGIWNEYFVYPLSWFLTWIADFFSGSYGLSIVIVTILIRLVLLPLMIQQTKSSKAMQALQPEMQKLKEKYSSKDQETQQKLQKETMELFQKHKVNPLAGCLPLIVQMPILLGFYHAIMRTEAIREQSFLWFSLENADYILAFIAGITTFLQQKLMMGSQSGAAANPQLKMMLYVMPVLIVVFAFNFPAALALYWVIGNLFMVGQTFLIKTPEVSTEGNGKTTK